MRAETKLMDAGFCPWQRDPSTGRWMPGPDDLVVRCRLDPNTLTYFVRLTDLPEGFELGSHVRMDDTLVFQFSKHLFQPEDGELVGSEYVEPCGNFRLVFLF